MTVTSVRLAEGRDAEVVRLGRPGGRPVLYFHSPASAGEELEGAAEVAADELGIELLAIVRRSLAAHDVGGRFMAAVASDADRLVDVLSLGPVAVLGWSGGAPYALAASHRLRSAVSAVHLVSPLPGPLVGPEAVAHQSERLQQIAATSATSTWAAAPGALRDYLAIVEPWPFDTGTIAQPVTIWAPTEDAIVPPLLIDHLARQLPQVEIIDVPGAHDWITENWSKVLQRIILP